MIRPDHTHAVVLAFALTSGMATAVTAVGSRTAGSARHRQPAAPPYLGPAKPGFRTRVDGGVRDDVASAGERVPVRVVLDGDTIDVGPHTRVRLLGIDAPELGTGFDTAAPFAVEARALLISLVAHRYVRLETEPKTLDRYGRRLAYVFREDGLFVNAELLRAGLARVSARVPLRRLDELRRAEHAAQEARRGLWGDRPSIPSQTRARSERRDPPRRAPSRRKTAPRRHRARP